jgi:hypothetical protein
MTSSNALELSLAGAGQKLITTAQSRTFTEADRIKAIVVLEAATFDVLTDLEDTNVLTASLMATTDELPPFAIITPGQGKFFKTVTLGQGKVFGLVQPY